MCAGREGIVRAVDVQGVYMGDRTMTVDEQAAVRFFVRKFGLGNGEALELQRHPFREQILEDHETWRASGGVVSNSPLSLGKMRDLLNNVCEQCGGTRLSEGRGCSRVCNANTGIEQGRLAWAKSGERAPVDVALLREAYDGKHVQDRSRLDIACDMAACLFEIEQLRAELLEIRESACARSDHKHLDGSVPLAVAEQMAAALQALHEVVFTDESSAALAAYEKAKSKPQS